MNVNDAVRFGLNGMINSEGKEEMTMEDKKNLNMEEIVGMNLEELDKVA